MSTDDLFQTFERIRVERTRVATITEDNIHQIARSVGGAVDYSEGEPFIVLPDKPDKPKFKWKVGWEVRSSGRGLVNMNGFNRDGDWKEVTS